jgi:CheY-like chemotaxis protein
MMPGAKVNLLIADDEPSIRSAFSEVFTKLGYSVRSAEDGFTALVAIRREIPDILLTDLNMPGISGRELLTVVRDQFPAIQAVAMSGDFSGVSIPPGVCADAFYEKGSRLDYLVQVVEAMSNAEQPSFLRHPSTPAHPWIPSYGHGPSGYADITLTCPECLRPFANDKAVCPTHAAGCVYCYSFDSLRNRAAGRPGVFAGFSAGAQSCGSSRLREHPISTRERNEKELPRCAR